MYALPFFGSHRLSSRVLCACFETLVQMKGVHLPPGILREVDPREGEQIKAALPPGRGHLCLETGALAATFRTIFQGSVLHSV
mmetsp:Transcript_6388/g.21372  ORF Transcript_6388/g.21372 Transcript_6388/m.21372 type:complete len:83 (+) Transcript_6388:106-354(+)